MREHPATQHDPAAVTSMLTEAAAALVSSTYPAPQAEPVLHGLANAYGATEAEIVLFPTLVISETKKNQVPQVRAVKTNYRFDQMVEAQSVIAQAREQPQNAEDVAVSLRRITQKKPIFPDWLRVLGYALSAAGYAAVFRMDIFAIVAAFAVGAVLGVLVLVLAKSARLVALIPLIATFVAGVCVSLASSILDKPDPVRLIAVIVVVLLPGATLTSGILELVSGFMISGTARLAYGIMILGTMVFGGVLGIALTGITASKLENVTTSLTPEWVAGLGVILYGIGTFLYFCTPKHLWLPSLTVMLISFAVAVFFQPPLGTAISAGLATAIGLIISWAINARLGGGPGDLAIFLPTFWLIVPGTSGFVAITGALEETHTLENFAGTAALTFFAMAIGMMIASAAYPALSKISPDTKKILQRGKGLLS